MFDHSLVHKVWPVMSAEDLIQNHDTWVSETGSDFTKLIDYSSQESKPRLETVNGTHYHLAQRHNYMGYVSFFF